MPLSVGPEEERRPPGEDRRGWPNIDERIIRQIRHCSTQREELHLPSTPGAQILRGSLGIGVLFGVLTVLGPFGAVIEIAVVVLVIGSRLGSEDGRRRLD